MELGFTNWAGYMKRLRLLFAFTALLVSGFFMSARPATALACGPETDGAQITVGGTTFECGLGVDGIWRWTFE